MAAFYMDYTDIQVSVSQEPFLFLRRLTNAAKAHISGFEADMAAQITNDLKLTASAGYVRTRYDRFTPRPTLDLSGQSFGTAPVWTFSFATDYRRSLSGGQTLSAHLDYTDRTAPSVTPPDALAFVGDHALFNGALGYGASNGRWRAQLWVKNITNVKKPVASKLWGAGLGPLIENETVRYQLPRMFGLSLTRTFGR
jgi:outer membrane receptor protein involved in Fe transport